MQGKAISLRVGNTQHLIPKIIMMFPHRTPCSARLTATVEEPKVTS